MLDDACSLFGDMPETEVRAKWPALHKVIKCADMGALQMCQPDDLVPLDPVKLLRYESAESVEVVAHHPAPTPAVADAHLAALITRMFRLELALVFTAIVAGALTLTLAVLLA